MKQSTLSNGVCVEICMPIAGNRILDVAEHIQSWVDDVWIPDNREWVRVWKTGANLAITAETETLRYEDDFLRSPEISLRDKVNLIIILRLKWPSKNWRDWLALKIIHDLRIAFPELKDSEPVYVKRRTNTTD